MLDDTTLDARKLPDNTAASIAAAIPWLAEAERMMRAEADELHGLCGMLHRLGHLNRHTPWTLPWCGLFVAHCLRTAMPDQPIPSLPVRSQPWRRWGRPVRPQLGAVMVFWHYHRRLPFGHAAFYWAEDSQAFHVLGGNQDHRICVKHYPKARFVTARWPRGSPSPGLTRTAPPEAARPFR